MKREELINVYIIEQKNLSKASLNEYLKHINNLFDYTNKNPLDVTRDDILSYLDVHDDLSSSTKHLFLSAINGFYKALNIRNITDKCPSYGIKLPKIKNKMKIPLTSNEVHYILNYCKNKRDYAFWTLMFSTGMRISEAIGLTLEQYYSRNEENIIIIEGKGDKERFICLNDNVIDAIEDYLTVRKDSSYDNLFISNGGKPLDRSCCSRSLKTIAKRTGRFNDYRIKTLCNHLTRTTFATNLINHEVPLDKIQDILGHENPNTTRIYAKRNTKSIVDTMKNFSI